MLLRMKSAGAVDTSPVQIVRVTSVVPSLQKWYNSSEDIKRKQRNYEMNDKDDDIFSFWHSNLMNLKKEKHSMPERDVTLYHESYFQSRNQSIVKATVIF